jgi:hypothetical protein
VFAQLDLSISRVINSQLDGMGITDTGGDVQNADGCDISIHDGPTSAPRPLPLAIQTKRAVG